jgi:hypothetical protein
VASRRTVKMYRQDENFLMMLKRKSRMPVVSVGEELDAAPLLGGVRFSEGGNNSPNTGTYGEAIMNELIPAIEQRFRISPHTYVW